MGFETKILELNYSAFPMFIDVIICLIFFPLIVYGLVQQFGEFILQKINDYQLS